MEQIQPSPIAHDKPSTVQSTGKSASDSSHQFQLLLSNIQFFTQVIHMPSIQFPDVQLLSDAIVML